MFREDTLHDLSGKKTVIPFLPVHSENLGGHTQADKERALFVLKRTTEHVKDFLTTELDTTVSSTDEPQFIFIELNQKAEFDEVSGVIYISNRYLKNLLELPAICVHELIHFYADRLFDFREIQNFFIKGRKLGISIRYTKENGQGVDGFGILDEVLVMAITKEICEKYGLNYFDKSTEPYSLEQYLVFNYISNQLPLKLKLWNSEKKLVESEITSVKDVLYILKNATFARLIGDKTQSRYRNAGRVLRKLFEGKPIKSIAIDTRRREPNEDLESYEGRILTALIDR